MQFRHHVRFCGELRRLCAPVAQFAHEANSSMRLFSTRFQSILCGWIELTTFVQPAHTAHPVVRLYDFIARIAKQRDLQLEALLRISLLKSIRKQRKTKQGFLAMANDR
jgi:hypothetical protein